MSATKRDKPLPFASALIADERHGPLPVILLGLTLITGVVDAVSILSLGRVFVANMTGNVVFVGFALAGAAGFSLGASLCALAGFLLGAHLGGSLTKRFGSHRGRLLFAGLLVELAATAGALAIVAAGSTPLAPGFQDGAAAALASALGIQNAVVRALAVPDLTTTVLTMTLTGLAADQRKSTNVVPRIRRTLAVVTMFAGALLGAVLVRKVSPTAGLALAVGVLVLLVVAMSVLQRGVASWHRA